MICKKDAGDGMVFWSAVKAEKRNDMWTVHIGSRDVVIISDDAFYSLFSGIV